jgi:hypothetical protein
MRRFTVLSTFAAIPFTAFATVFAVGCASAPPPPPATPTVTSGTPDWVQEVAHRANDFDFAPTAPVNAKAPAAAPPPSANMRVDSATGYDVKNAHLRAAQVAAKPAATPADSHP